MSGEQVTGKKEEVKGVETALLPCPFCGNKGEMSSGCGEYWVKCRACDATTRMMNREADAAVWWNKRIDESVEIVERLKQRGVIPSDFDASKIDQCCGEVAP